MDPTEYRQWQEAYRQDQALTREFEDTINQYPQAALKLQEFRRLLKEFLHSEDPAIKMDLARKVDAAREKLEAAVREHNDVHELHARLKQRVEEIVKQTRTEGS